jgi:hypothetical protein
MRLRRRYNIVALLASGTDLVGEFENCCTAVIGPLVDRPLAEAEHALKRLSESFPIDYAIANSAKMAAIIRGLASDFVPVVTLVDTLDSNPQSVAAREQALDWSTDVVFPDQVTADTARHEHPTLLGRKLHILPHAPPEQSDADSIAKRAAHDDADLDQYVLQLDQLGRNGIAIMRQRALDFTTLRDSPLFDEGVFLPSGSVSREVAIKAFLARWSAVGTNRQPSTNFFFRRPCAGFHPQVYAHENAHSYDAALVNPLAHLIRSGAPDGPWRHDVIAPGVRGLMRARAAQLRAAIHGHFFYPELVADFLQRLACNRTRCDLWFTTDDPAKGMALRTAAAAYDCGNVTVRIVPNRGRDMGPFLTAILEEIESRYDVVGHIHGKRSPQTLVGEEWREFLWQNLLGRSYPMMDIILDCFAADEALGIVFPDDPHLPDWDSNLGIATQLAARIGIKRPLPPFFSFPVGTMFWARPQALKPLFELNLDWLDYPEEPLPNDGTILHAIERLLPFVIQHAGYRYAATRVPQLTW